MVRRGRIRIGIGGWVFEPWRQTFYPADLPQSRELEYASRRLTSIEVNGTFYRSQKPQTFRKWHDATPEGFVFALKAPRYATNRRVLAEAGESARRFLDSGITELGDKLGPINWQFPPTRKFDPGEFEAFLQLLPERQDGRALRHAVEVRHESFCCKEFVRLARRHKVAVVISADGQYPQIADLTAPFVYLRIMGTQAGHALGYGPRDLDLWAHRLRQWSTGTAPGDLQRWAAPVRAAPRDVYLYVISGDKPLNPLAAMALIERLED